MHLLLKMRAKKKLLSLPPFLFRRCRHRRYHHRVFVPLLPFTVQEVFSSLSFSLFLSPTHFALCYYFINNFIKLMLFIRKLVLAFIAHFSLYLVYIWNFLLNSLVRFSFRKKYASVVYVVYATNDFAFLIRLGIWNFLRFSYPWCICVCVSWCCSCFIFSSPARAYRESNRARAEQNKVGQIEKTLPLLTLSKMKSKKHKKRLSGAKKSN